MASATATEITRRRQYREKLGKAEVVKSASQAHTPCLESAHPPPVHACPPILSLSPFAQSYSHGFGVPVTGQRSTIDGDMREAMHWTREEKKKSTAQPHKETMHKIIAAYGAVAGHLWCAAVACMLVRWRYTAGLAWTVCLV